MVGTAVYQVGFASSIPAKNFSALKPGVQNTAPPRDSGAEQAGDQPVDVEQRHDVETAVVGSKARAWRRCCGPRSRCCAGDSGTIFGREVVPDVCRISAMSSASAGPGRARWRLSPSRTAGTRRPRPAAREQAYQRDAELLRRAKRGRVAARFDDQGLGLEVGEVELELVGAIGGIERRRGRGGGDGDETPSPSRVRSATRWRPDRRGRCRSRSASGRCDRSARAGRVGQRRRLVRGDGDRVVMAPCDEASQGAIRAHVSSTPDAAIVRASDSLHPLRATSRQKLDHRIDRIEMRRRDVGEASELDHRARPARRPRSRGRPRCPAASKSCGRRRSRRRRCACPC